MFAGPSSLKFYFFMYQRAYQVPPSGVGWGEVDVMKLGSLVCGGLWMCS